MIDDYIDEGMTEDEGCEKLGSIDEIVESIAGDIPLKDIAKKKLEKRSAERAKYAQKRKAKTSNNDPIQHK